MHIYNVRAVLKLASTWGGGGGDWEEHVRNKKNRYYACLWCAQTATAQCCSWPQDIRGNQEHTRYNNIHVCHWCGQGPQTTSHLLPRLKTVQIYFTCSRCANVPAPLPPLLSNKLYLNQATRVCQSGSPFLSASGLHWAAELQGGAIGEELRPWIHEQEDAGLNPFLGSNL